MTTAADTAVAAAFDSAAAVHGRTVTYRRDGVTAGTLTMIRARQPSQYVDDGQGGLIEVSPVDFLGKTSALPFDPPLAGDQIVDAETNETYEVLPTVGEKVYRRISDSMTRVHTKQVASQ